jgi:DNA-binding GntR family transcriptional regulator
MDAGHFTAEHAAARGICGHMKATVEPGRSRDGQHVALVHERLRNAILRGEVPAGYTASQAALASRLEVGRTPLREALRMLEREGLVVSEPNRPVRVAGLSSSDAEELYVMRISLEAVAIRITVPRLASADIAELEGLLAQMDHYMRARDNTGLRQPHRAFHLALVAGSGPRVTETIGQLFDHAERYRLAFGAATPEILDQRREEHRSIVDAVSVGDTDLAADRLVAHYAHTAALVFAGLDPGHDLARLRTTIATVAPGAEDALAASSSP